MKKNVKGLIIARVSEKLTSYKLHLNDNSVIELPRDEIGDFVPRTGMKVRYSFYQGLILQKIELDGKSVLDRSVLDIIVLLESIDDKLDEDTRKALQGHDDPILESLEPIFRYRIEMIRFLASEDNIPFDAIDYETCRCSLAQTISEQGLERVEAIEKMNFSMQQKVLMADIEEEFVGEIISMAKAYLADKATFDLEKIDISALMQSKILAEWSCIFDFEKDKFEELRNLYIETLKA